MNLRGKMPGRDEWGEDPSVQSMRRIFGGMERAQKGLLSGLGIGGFDPRLGGIRTQARILFDRLWSEAARRRLLAGEEAAVLFYMHCFCRALAEGGIDVGTTVFEPDEKIVGFLAEVLG